MFRNLLWCRINSVGAKMKLRKNEEITAGKVSSQVCHWMNRGYMFRRNHSNHFFNPYFYYVIIEIRTLTARPNRKFHRSSLFWMLIYVKVVWSNTKKKCTTADRPPICWSLRSLLPQASWRREPFFPSYHLVRGVWKNFVEDVVEVTQLDLAIKLQQNLKLIPRILWGGILFLTLTMAATLGLNFGVGFLMFWMALYGHMVSVGDDQCGSVTEWLSG